MKTAKNIGIIGYGFVGKAMHKLFPDAVCYDVAGELANNKEKINQCDAVFVCVPTDLKKDGTLNMDLVEEVIKTFTVNLFIVRSALQPGFSEYIAEKYPDKRISVVPEYIGETIAHPLLNERDIPFLIIGGTKAVREEVIAIFATVYNSNITIRQVNNYAAEIIKLCENRAIAWKVMQMHELYKVCEAAHIDYYTLRDAVYGDDPRFDLNFSFIYKDNLGFESSKCLRKDVPAFVAWAKQSGYDAKLTKLLSTVSKEYAKSTQN